MRYPAAASPVRRPSGPDTKSYISEQTDGSHPFMVTVTNLTPRSYSLSAFSGRARPLVETHMVSSGNSAEMSPIASKVCSLARGSPGPAMPMTLSSGILDFTARTFSRACAGVSTSLVTPGRDSLLQSYLRLQ